MSDEQTLIAALCEMAEKKWSEQQAPVMLSSLPRLLETTVPEYRAVLGSRSLKRFVKDTEQAGTYRLIEHPTIRAKVAFAPDSANYQFPASSSDGRSPMHSTRQATLAFLSALAHLPEAEQEKVIIPTSILSKLLK